GVSEYLSTEISTSRQKRFSLVTFVDTPGLVDGDMKYPFDVDQALLWLGQYLSVSPVLSCVCTDQALLWLGEERGESWTGQRGREERGESWTGQREERGESWTGQRERERVMMQIVQELCKRPGLNKCGFDMPTIYVPNPNKPSRCVNQIDEVCRTIEKTINQTVQNTLNALERDCEVIASAVRGRLQTDREDALYNRRARCQGCVCGPVCPSLPLSPPLSLSLSPSLPLSADLSVPLSLSLSLLTCLSLSPPLSTRPTLSGKQKRQIQEKLEYVQDVVKDRKRKLYEDYLRQSVCDHDMD
uniref:Si:ch211-11k18.4 n=1 Tax=Lepisosteus oculatus TaxID=7918 RepID=W5LW45_LEPOC